MAAGIPPTESIPCPLCEAMPDEKCHINPQDFHRARQHALYDKLYDGAVFMVDTGTSTLPAQLYDTRPPTIIIYKGGQRLRLSAHSATFLRWGVS